MTIDTGVGFSRQKDATAAGKEAASIAVSRLCGKNPALVVVFTTPRFDLTALLLGIRSIVGNAQIVGATGSGEIVAGEYLGFGGGVSILAMTAGPYRFGTASSSFIRGNLDQAGQHIARQSQKEAGESNHAALVLLSDCLVGDLQMLFKGAYRVTGPKVAITGGAAGDELKFKETFVFHNNEVVKQGAVGLWIASDHPLPVATRHGWEPLGIPLLVTRTQGTEIVELGGRPAIDAYEEQLGISKGTLTPDNFWDTSIMHPFGLLQSDGSTVIRVARAKTPEGTLRIQGCVPPTGSAVQVMTSSKENLLNITEEVIGSILHQHPRAGAILVFSCAARAVIFGPDTPQETLRLQKAAKSAATFGFYCCGEFARTAGVLGTHNATLTALAL